MKRIAWVLCALWAPAAAGCGEESGRMDRPDAMDEIGEEAFSVVSKGGFTAPAPVCEEEPPEMSCDSRLPLDCADEGAHIDFDPDDDSPCPICVEPRPEDPTTCGGWKQRYGEFLADNISQSCVNWCDGADSDCYGWEMKNSCGIFAVALNGYIDEETLIFAREFAQDNCDDVCGAAPATEGQLDELDEFGAACIDNQCVLVPQAGGEPDTTPDASPSP